MTSRIGPDWLRTALRILSVIVLLYLFLVGIKLMGTSFKLFGGDVIDDLIRSYSNPLLGLCTGILATSLVQSSSTTTSLVVGLVGGGVLSVEAAIPIIMGANVGTTITNTLVSWSLVARKADFRRAFAAATVHDLFNLCSILVFFPLEITLHIVEKSAVFLTSVFEGVGGVTFASPFKTAVAPAVDGVKHFLLDTLSAPDLAAAIAILIIAIGVTVASLVYLVRMLRSLTVNRAENFFHRYLFRNAGSALLFGTLLTVAVQSSSITTSLMVPLVGAGVVTLVQAYPYTIGANIGTTATAMIASLATVGGDGVAAATVGVTVAFSHLLFNLFGTAVFLPLRRVPIFLANRLAAVAAESKRWAVLFVLGVFFVLPLVILAVSWAVTD
jgi:sodium-dependent phosphate cotransporter